MLRWGLREESRGPFCLWRWRLERATRLRRTLIFLGAVHCAAPKADLPGAAFEPAGDTAAGETGEAHDCPQIWQVFNRPNAQGGLGVDVEAFGNQLVMRADPLESGAEVLLSQSGLRGDFELAFDAVDLVSTGPGQGVEWAFSSAEQRSALRLELQPFAAFSSTFGDDSGPLGVIDGLHRYRFEARRSGDQLHLVGLLDGAPFYEAVGTHAGELSSTLRYFNTGSTVGGGARLSVDRFEVRTGELLSDEFVCRSW